jgi:hypothetical protein
MAQTDVVVNLKSNEKKHSINATVSPVGPTTAGTGSGSLQTGGENVKFR